MALTTTPCAVCGMTPTLRLMIRRHIGLIFVQRFISVDKPLCRTHGRHYTKLYLNKTLVQGWWGVFSFFINFYDVCSDVSVLRKYSSLDEPSAPAHQRRDRGGTSHLGRRTANRIGRLVAARPLSTALAIRVFPDTTYTPQTLRWAANTRTIIGQAPVQTDITMIMGVGSCEFPVSDRAGCFEEPATTSP